MLEDLVQAMQKKVEELAPLNAANMEPYHQLMESGALTEEAISVSLTQDEASELEYRAGVAELRGELRVSSPNGGDAAAVPLFSTNSGAVLHASALLHLLYLTFELPN